MSQPNSVYGHMGHCSSSGFWLKYLCNKVVKKGHASWNLDWFHYLRCVVFCLLQRWGRIEPRFAAAAAGERCSKGRVGDTDHTTSVLVWMLDVAPAVVCLKQFKEISRTQLDKWKPKLTNPKLELWWLTKLRSTNMLIYLTFHLEKCRWNKLVLAF